MTKITFMGAGSTIFAKNIIGDAMLTDCLRDSNIALYDIDAERLHESKLMLENLNKNINDERAVITTHLGIKQRKAALKDADFVINAIQVGGYEPSTVADFEIPKKYGLRQTIGDTIGIGGIFRALRTIPVLEGFANDMKAVCPRAWFLNYTNPMSILTGFLIRKCGIKTVGLCHSVQVCAEHLLRELGLWEKYNPVTWKIAGINHMAWLLEIAKDGRSIYPELIEELNIPLDEYLRRCQNQIAGWHRQRDEIVHNKQLTHTRTLEYGSYIMEAMITDKPIEIGGNVLNNGLISNLPPEACVEVPCLVNRNGVQGCAVGELPPQCAALNMTHINVHNLVIEAAMAKSRSLVYQAAMLDPHTRSELTLDEIKSMCDDLFEAHVRDGVMLEYK